MTNAHLDDIKVLGGSPRREDPLVGTDRTLVINFHKFELLITCLV